MLMNALKVKGGKKEKETLFCEINFYELERIFLFNIRSSFH